MNQEIKRKRKNSEEEFYEDCFDGSENRRSTASLVMPFQTCKSIRAVQQL